MKESFKFLNSNDDDDKETRTNERKKKLKDKKTREWLQNDVRKLNCEN